MSLNVKYNDVFCDRNALSRHYWIGLKGQNTCDMTVWSWLWSETKCVINWHWTDNSKTQYFDVDKFDGNGYCIVITQSVGDLYHLIRQDCHTSIGQLVEGGLYPIYYICKKGLVTRNT